MPLYFVLQHSFYVTLHKIFGGVIFTKAAVSSLNWNEIFKDCSREPRVCQKHVYEMPKKNALNYFWNYINIQQILEQQKNKGQWNN